MLMLHQHSRGLNFLFLFPPEEKSHLIRFTPVRGRRSVSFPSTTFFSFLFTNETFSHTPIVDVVIDVMHVDPSEVISVSSSFRYFFCVVAFRGKINLGFKQTNEAKVEAKPLKINHLISCFLFF